MSRAMDLFRKKPTQSVETKQSEAPCSEPPLEKVPNCEPDRLESSPSRPSSPEATGNLSPIAPSPSAASRFFARSQPAGDSGNSGNFSTADSQENKYSRAPRRDHKEAIDILRRLKSVGANVTWDGYESEISFGGTTPERQEGLDLYGEGVAKIESYLADELPEFPPAERQRADKLMRALGVEVTVPSNSEQAKTLVLELIASSGDFGLVLDVETATLPPWKIARPPLVFRADGSVADHQPRYALEAALDPHRSRIRLIQIAGRRRKDIRNRVLIIDTDLIPATDEALLPIWRSKLWIHNAAFDVKHFIAAGVDLSRAEIVDTMLLAGMVHRCEPNGNLPAPSRPSLAKYAETVLGVDLPKSGQVSDWSRETLSREQLTYAALDVALLALLIPKSWNNLPDEPSKACVLRASAATLAVAHLELAGMAIDPTALEKAANAWAKEIEDLTGRIRAVGGPERPNSPMCVGKWLESALPPEVFAVWPRTSGGALSTEGKLLRRAVEHHEAIQLLVRRAKVAKMASSFGHSLLKKINPATGRLHCNLKISGAKTGRFSCSDPNLQQIPSRGEQGAFMRSIFVAPPGCVLIGADYSQLELRVLAAVSGDPAMNAAFANGQDLHAITACGMLRIAPEEFDIDNPIHKAARASAKAVNFGIIYGCGATGLAEFARDAYGVSMTQAEAAHAMAQFLNTYEGAADWMENAASDANRYKCIRTAGGRIYPAAYEPLGEISRQQALNFPIQGAAAEVALEAIIRIEKALRDIPQARLIAQVHDEFLLEADDEPTCVAAASAALEAGMREGFGALFPHALQTGLVDVGVGRNWAELKG
ncbi:MAG: DNA polymerase [Methylocystis sp.]|uniref:DNA polymerase n=1 Tax=Methylocystis sp. TaxID=1911079 RepID=UPI003DA6A3C3